MIACVDNDLGIGDSEGNLLFHIPEDLKHFRKETEGNIVVMGRKTFESFGKPLKNRDNYVLTSNKGFLYEGVTTLNSKEDVLSLTDKGDVFIIGGGEIYKEFIDYADMLIITHVDATSDKAVAFFPKFVEWNWEVRKEKRLHDDSYEVIVKWYRKIRGYA